MVASEPVLILKPPSAVHPFVPASTLSVNSVVPPLLMTMSSMKAPAQMHAAIGLVAEPELRVRRCHRGSVYRTPFQLSVRRAVERLADLGPGGAAVVEYSANR